MRRPLVFVTDYGRADSYAAALAGAALRADPEARCFDGTHDIPAGDVLAAAYQLKALALAFDEPVFCAVVDPGVGTSRRAIAVQAGDTYCVAPDNGLVTYLWSECDPAARRAVRVPTPNDASATFHGRDVFAPTAARLAAGAQLDDLGPRLDDPLILGHAFAEREGPELYGVIVAVDHFGNAISSVRAADLADAHVVAVEWTGGETHRFVRTYADIGRGLAALIGSAGHLELAAQGAPAVRYHGPNMQDEITVLLA